MDSVHDKLSRVRKPRVHISYQVETEGAEVERELPFVVGVMGDFSGNPAQPPKPLGERRFSEIDRDSFDKVMAAMTPGVKMRVPNTLRDDGSEMAVELNFRSMEDFEPARIVEQVQALRTLLETRNRLRDLLSKADRSENLEELLDHILQDNAELRRLSGELGIPGGDQQTGGEGERG